MQKFLMTFLLLVWGLPLIGQSTAPELSFGAKIAKHSKAVPNNNLHVAGYYEGGSVLYQAEYSQLAGTKVLTFYKFDEDLALVSKKKFTPYLDGRTLTFQTAYTHENRIFVLATYSSRKRDERVLELLEVSIDDFSLLANREILACPRPTNEINFDFSPDGSVIGIEANHFSSEAKEDHYYFWAFEPSLAPIWAFDTVLSTQSASWEFVRMELNAKAELVVDINETIYEEGKKSRGSIGSMRHLWTFQQQGQSRHQYQIEPDKHRLKPFVFHLQRSGKLICMGLYANKEDKLEGIVRFDFAPEAHEEPTITYTRLQGSNDQQVWNGRLDKSGFKINTISCDKMIMKSDGSVILISHFGKVDTYFLFGDIIVTSIDPNGKIEWGQRVEILNMGVGLYLQNPCMISVQKDNIWFVFNDSRLTNKRKVSFTDRHKSGTLEAVSISPTGEKKRHRLGYLSDSGTYIDHYTAPLIGADRILFVGGEGSEIKAAAIKF